MSTTLEEYQMAFRHLKTYPHSEWPAVYRRMGFLHQGWLKRIKKEGYRGGKAYDKTTRSFQWIGGYYECCADERVIHQNKIVDFCEDVMAYA